jgi:hypothetical protein
MLVAPRLAPSPLPAYVNTVPQLEARMRALAAKFPQLVQLRDIGDSATKVAAGGASGAGHDIWGLVVGRPTTTAGAATPVVGHLGGLHPSEWANPHLLLEWAERTLARYGTDPEVTRLLDAGRAAMVPLTNPDVYAQSIANPSRFFRGNARGVDLNRNFPGTWAAGRDHGTGPASEPEVAAATSFIGALRPTALIDWHSYQQTNLYNDQGRAGLNKVFAERVGRINGYEPRHSDRNYRTTGTGKDWGSASLGVPALTIETGASFAQPGTQFDDTLKRNIPVLDWLLTHAADPVGAIGWKPAPQPTSHAATAWRALASASA